MLWETFRDSDLNVIYVCDLKGVVVWGKAYDLKTEETIQLRELPGHALPQGHPLLVYETNKRSIGGVLATERGPMLVASSSITTSDNTGPIRGSFIMGRFLDEDMVEALVEQTRVDFRLFLLTDDAITAEEAVMVQDMSTNDGPVISEAGSHLLQVYATFQDIYGAPALLARADIPRDISAKGITAMGFALFSLMAAAGVMVFVMAWLLQGIVVGPIVKMTDHAAALGASGDLSARLSLERSDEIGVLAREFDSMTRRLLEAQRNLLEMSYHAGKAEIATNAIHNIRNALSPIVGSIDMLREDLKEARLGKLEMVHKELVEGNPSPERRGALTQYLGLAIKNLVSLGGHMQSTLADVIKSAQSIERMLDVQSRVSHFARPQETVKLEEVVRESLAPLADEVRNGVSVTTDASLETMPAIMTHRLSLVQVFASILHNAIESIHRTGSGSGKVCISAKTDKSDGRSMIHVQIEDNGEGIDPGNLRRIFGRDSSPHSQGIVGTGLHWCATAISAMNGQLYADSKGVGHGACFHLLLPEHP
jgi:signal transduction histidine kinase